MIIGVVTEDVFLQATSQIFRDNKKVFRTERLRSEGLILTCCRTCSGECPVTHVHIQSTLIMNKSFSQVVG